MVKKGSSPGIEELYAEYLEQITEQGDRCVEPKNGGPRIPEFFEVVHQLATGLDAKRAFVHRLHNKAEKAT